MEIEVVFFLLSISLAFVTAQTDAVCQLHEQCLRLTDVDHYCKKASPLDDEGLCAFWDHDDPPYVACSGDHVECRGLPSPARYCQRQRTSALIEEYACAVLTPTTSVSCTEEGHPRCHNLPGLDGDDRAAYHCEPVNASYAECVQQPAAYIGCQGHDDCLSLPGMPLGAYCRVVNQTHRECESCFYCYDQPVYNDSVSGECPSACTDDIRGLWPYDIRCGNHDECPGTADGHRTLDSFCRTDHDVGTHCVSCSICADATECEASRALEPLPEKCYSTCSSHDHCGSYIRNLTEEEIEEEEELDEEDLTVYRYCELQYEGDDTFGKCHDCNLCNESASAFIVGGACPEKCGAPAAFGGTNTSLMLWVSFGVALFVILS